jgi:ATP-dependent Clp protease ATP-binding subunit ClpB
MRRVWPSATTINTSNRSTCFRRCVNQGDGSGALAAAARRRATSQALQTALGDALERLPQVSGTAATCRPGRELTGLLNLADKEAQKLVDTFIASEMFCSRSTDDKGDAGTSRARKRLDAQVAGSAIAAVRGGSQVR